MILLILARARLPKNPKNIPFRLRLILDTALLTKKSVRSRITLGFGIGGQQKKTAVPKTLFLLTKLPPSRHPQLRLLALMAKKQLWPRLLFLTPPVSARLLPVNPAPSR